MAPHPDSLFWNHVPYIINFETLKQISIVSSQYLILLMTLLDRRSEGPMKYLPSDRLSVCPFLDSFFRVYKFSDILHGFMVSSNLKSGRFGWFKNNLVLGFSGQKDESKWGFSSFMKNQFVEFFWYFVWSYSNKSCFEVCGSNGAKTGRKWGFSRFMKCFRSEHFSFYA